MNQSINVGIVGFGLSGRYFFAPYISHHPGFNLKSFVSSQEASILQEYPKVQVHQKIDTLLGDPSIDLIVVASPNYTHFEYARKALEAGKHVVLEKPFTVTVKEADSLIALAEKQGKILAPFQNRRWDGDFITLQHVLAEGHLGEILEFESHFDRYRPEDHRAPWKNEELAGNGVLYDLGPHLIDQALCLFGKPKAVYADLRSLRKNTRLADTIEIHLNYGHLRAILKAGVFVKKEGPRFIVHGRNGSFVKYGLDPQEGNLRQGMQPDNGSIGVDKESHYGTISFMQNGKSIERKVPSKDGDYMQYFDNVYRAVANREKLAVSPQDGRLIIDIIEKSYLSNQLRKEIEV